MAVAVAEAVLRSPDPNSTAADRVALALLLRLLAASMGGGEMRSRAVIEKLG